MPELPEVETVANGVDARVRGQRILRVWTSGKPQTFKSPEADIAQALTHTTIQRVHRVGKTIVFDLQPPTLDPTPTPHTLSSRPGLRPAKTSGETRISAQTLRLTTTPADLQFLVHLGMTGRLLVSRPELPLPPHTHAVLTLADHREIRFVDPRRFGRLSILRPTPQQPAGYTGPGAEPTTISPEAFAQLFRGRKLAIKAALLNQSILHGIGNIYADEALFRARIRPRRHAGRLTRAELTRLHAALQQVLAHAIQLGGSSVSDYVDAAGIRGFFQLEHKVYSRAHQPCKDCSTPLKKIIVGGRTTVFCPTCQH